MIKGEVAVQIAFLILSCLAIVFAMSFLAAAVFTFATHDQKPLDAETDKMLSLMAWFGSGGLVYFFVVTRYWRQCQLGRRFFYTGLAAGALAVVFGVCAARGG